MTIDWWTLGLQTVNAAVLIWLLARFLFRPVGRILAERQAAARAALDDAEAARAAAKAELEKARAENEAIGHARAELLAEARKAADRERQRLMDEAEAALGTARAAQKAELERMREAEARALGEDAARLAADIAGRLFERLPDAARVEGFIDGLAEALADLPETTRARLGADGPVTIRAPRPLTPGERDHLDRKLGEVLGAPLPLEIETDSGLIAGLELVAPHAVVRNNLRADLERIRKELTLDE